MQFQACLMHTAVLSALASFALSANAQSNDANNSSDLSTVTVTAAPFGKAGELQILNPAKVLAGPELRAKLGTSLGETLGNELGVAASGFGAGASRPIIRGLEGPRVKILQNGLAVADVSSISNDHAVATESATAQQIEILRGPAALLYGSGAIGGLINVVDNRIPTVLFKNITGEAELRYDSVNQEKNASAHIDGAAGDIAWHLDGNARKTNDYRIPGRTESANPDAPLGRLPTSFTRENSVTGGLSLVQNWGYAGVAIQNLNDKYGIPTDEKSFIDLQQTRYDFSGAIKAPFAHFKDLQFKAAYTDYKHSENAEDGTALTDFKNRSAETRLTIAHEAWAGWEGVWGIQTENTRFSALSASTGRTDTVPTTKSSSVAAFAVEQRQFGDVVINVGGRIENVDRKPRAEFQLQKRDFTLGSASIGALWQFSKDYAAGVTGSYAQRAPTTEELYSNGPHESTATFDIGDNLLGKEKSRNLELSLQKTTGLIRWKINAFVNKIDNFVYGSTDNIFVDEEGTPEPDGEFLRREWIQAKATIRGAEAEISYNEHGEGFSARGFADTSRGRLDKVGSLPLQPATRIGGDIGYRQAGWRGVISLVHAKKQDRLASFESFETPSYTKVDFNLSYSHPFYNSQLTWFAYGKNLFNQDIRLATSVLRETVPQPGRGVVLGVRATF
jgi:iron complex outermembrane recepter protein